MTEYLTFQETRVIQKIVRDYLYSPNLLKDFFNYIPAEASVKEGIDNRKKFAVNRALLTQRLSSQYEGINTTTAVKQNIERLQSENTFTLTTAHQPNLLLGPLYVIHKIVSILKLTQQLNKQYSSTCFVPVFWMGTEDHDKDELAHIHLFGKRVEWNTMQQGAFGRFVLEDIGEVKQQVFDILGNSDRVAYVQQWLQQYYFSQPNIERATRSLLNEIFGEYGLVIIHGDDAVLKKSFMDIMRDDLIKQSPCNIISDTNDQLIQRGYNVQAVPRTINLFYLREKSRERIQLEKTYYRIGEASVSREELVEELEKFPERFSPNVILRPLYQAMILPDVVFIGGGAEVSYHLQLKKLFEFYQVHYPIIVQRDLALYTQNPWRTRLKKLDLEVKDLFKPLSVLIHDYVANHATSNIDFKEELSVAKSLFEGLKEKATQSDITLKAFVEAEYKKLEHSIETIAEKVIRSEKRKMDAQAQQLTKLREAILPQDRLHERYDNFLPFYLQYGNEYIGMLMQSFNLWDTRLKVIQLS